MSPSGIDQSFSFADPHQAKAAGVQVVSSYLSYDTSKNWTPAKVVAYHQVGIAVLLNWEATAGAPLDGAARGRADAIEAVRQAKDLISHVGYAPRNRITLYFSCDTDANPVNIAAYYQAAQPICHAAGFGLGAYGSARVVAYLAGQKITDSEWQTLAWSNGQVSPDADFYQSSINNTLGGAAVDYDQILHPYALGAWWPPGSPMNAPAPPPPPPPVPTPVGGGAMFICQAETGSFKAHNADPRMCFLLTETPTGMHARHITDFDEWTMLRDRLKVPAKPPQLWRDINRMGGFA